MLLVQRQGPYGASPPDRHKKSLLRLTGASAGLVLPHSLNHPLAPATLRTPKTGVVFSGEPRSSGSWWQSLSQWVDIRIRRTLNARFYSAHRSTIEQWARRVKSLRESSPLYVPTVLEAATFFFGGGQYEINTESGRLKAIVDRGEPCVFVLNHQNPVADAKALHALIKALYETYAQAGRLETCPRPKILVNQAILKGHAPKVQQIMEKLGAIGIDASVTPTPDRARENSRVLRPLITQFRQNQAHVFLFPEGKRGWLARWRPEESQVQPGVAKLIQLLLNRTGRVHVVPVGLAYPNRTHSVDGSIYVGEPIRLDAKPGEEAWWTPGNISAQTHPELASTVTPESRFPLPSASEKRTQALLRIVQDNMAICAENAHRQIL